MIVLHNSNFFELDAQIKTPLRWPGKRAPGMGDDLLGGPWGFIVHVKQRTTNFRVFNFNAKSNCFKVRFYVHDGRKQKKEN